VAEYYKEGKKNWAKLIFIYIVVGGIVYALIYYFFFRHTGASNYSLPSY